VIFSGVYSRLAAGCTGCTADAEERACDERELKSERELQSPSIQLLFFSPAISPQHNPRRPSIH